MSSTTQPATSWHRGRVAGWIVSVDHKRVGALYLAWAAVFLVIGGILPLLMRIQMTKPDAGFLGDSTYAGMRTMHGTLLVFFVLVPVVVGLATYLVPLMIGADRIEKPGLAAMSLWLFGFGGAAVVLSAFAKGGSSEAGWAGYPPAAITQDGHGVDLWLIGMILLALSVLASAGEPRGHDPDAPRRGHDLAEPAGLRVVGARVGVRLARPRASCRARTGAASCSSGATRARSTSSSPTTTR